MAYSSFMVGKSRVIRSKRKGYRVLVVHNPGDTLHIRSFRGGGGKWR